MSTLTLESVTKSFDPSHALAVDDVSFDVADGELLVLVGPSGCGKSTVLKMIAGLEDATSGEIRIDGQRVNELGPRERDVAMVFQSYALYPHLTVRKNIAYPLKVTRTSRREIEQRVGETAELLQLTDLLDRRPAELSGGQRQRVAMGRAIVRRPRLFLMDEPLSNLDARLRVQMRAEISNLQRELGVTTVYVTHDQVEAMTMGSRVAVLLAGRLQQLAAPRELYDRPVNRFVAGFVGSPPMNLLDATVVDAPVRDGGEAGQAARRLAVEGHSLAVPADLVPATLPADARVVAGLRPEDLTLDPTGAAGATSAAGPARSAGSAGAAARLPVTVTLVEELGAEEMIHLRLGHRDAVDLVAGPAEPGPEEPGSVPAAGAGASLVVRTNGVSALTIGDRAHVEVDVHRIRLFDSTTGQVL